MTQPFHVTQLRLRSSLVQPTEAERAPESDAFINPGRNAAALAERVQAILETHPGLAFERHVEDFGILFKCRSEAPFGIEVVCGNLEGSDPEADLHLVFVEPARKVLRRLPWLKSQLTAPWVPDLVAALHDGLSRYPDITELALVPHDQPL